MSRTLTAVLLLALGASAARAQTFTQVTDPTNPIVTDQGPTQYSGASWVDYDGDDDLDLYVNNNFLYRNDGGGVFVRVITFIGAFQGIVTGNGNSWADYDNDGDLDCYVTGSTSILYQNDGSGSFSQVGGGDIGNTLGNRGWACAWGDVDNDGNVDLFVTHPCGFVGSCTVNRVLLNDGPPSYTFTQRDTSVISTGFDAYTVGSFADYDLDGDLDYFVGSGPASAVPDEDNLYRNMFVETGQDFFTRINDSPIATDLVDGQLWNWIDYDNDRDLDAYLTNWGGNGSVLVNNLYRNDGGSFTKVLSAGIATDAFVSLSSIWGDYDNDGDIDCYVTNDQSQLDRYYRNNGDGTFTSLALPPTTENLTHRGGTNGDYDDDGDLDLFLVGPGAARRLYRNDTANGNAWVIVECVGTTSNRAGIGTRLEVLATIDGNPVWQMREISTQNTFNGHNMLPAHFGLGDATTIDSLVIHWPSGIVEGFDNVMPNQKLTATEGSGIGTVDVVSPVLDGPVLELEGAAPNPFQSSTQIAFTLGIDADVRLDLFDLSGRLLGTVLDEPRAAGRHQVQITGEGLPTGVLFYRLRAGAEERSGRLWRVR